MGILSEFNLKNLIVVKENVLSAGLKTTEYFLSQTISSFIFPGFQTFLRHSPGSKVVNYIQLSRHRVTIISTKNPQTTSAPPAPFPPASPPSQLSAFPPLISGIRWQGEVKV